MKFDTIKTVTNGAAELAYGVCDPETQSAPTICLIASTGRGADDFVHLAHELTARGFRVLVPWPRGMAPSKGPLEDIDFHDLAADVVAILQAEPSSTGTIVAGHAYGCWIARTVAQDRPDLIDGLALIAAGGGTWPKELSEAINVAMSYEQPEDKRLAALQLAFFAPGSDPRPYLTGWNGDLVRAQRAARARTDRDTWWPSGTAPILDIVGLQDPFRPADARDVYVKEFPNRVTLITVDGASHALPDELPEEVATQLANWAAQTL
jgi:pimeloyl-ACP methyl ester carboxylesterase